MISNFCAALKRDIPRDHLQYYVPPVDGAVPVVELVRDGVHLEPGARELVLEYPLDELVAGVVAVGVLVDLVGREQLKST